VSRRRGWQYKEGQPVSGQDKDRVDWLRQILEWQQDLQDPRDFIQLVKVDLYPEEVYTFTPKGRVLSFRRGATPIDFAYARSDTIAWAPRSTARSSR
jgi:GTP pyrophosphokinase